MNSKIKEKRWKIAQKYEKEWWEHNWKKLKEQQKSLSEDYWKFHLKILQRFFHIKQKHKILEIGGGPNPFINYIPGCEKVVLDPLVNYYLSNFKVSKKIKWVKGVGEQVPFQKNYFDLVICVNTLDHVNNPQKVFGEINRVLKKGALVYFTVDCYDPLFKKYRVLREKCGVGDKCHPHSFSIKDMKKIIKDSGFKIKHLQEGIGDLGDYIEEKTISKESKISNLVKVPIQKKIMRVFSKIILRALILIITFSREKPERDIIFVISKV